MSLRALVVLSILLAAACAPPPSSLDAGGAPFQDGGDDDDAGRADAGPANDAGPPADAGPLLVTAAVPGARCALEERVGLVEVEAGDGFVSAYASWFDGPSPSLGPPALTDARCVFHEAGDGSGCACALDEVCAFDGTCVDRPRPHEGLRLVVRAGDLAQELSASQGFGTIGGEVTLAATAFAIELQGGGHGVTLIETAVPAPLTGLAATLTGTYDAPEAVDISWPPAGDGSAVFTHIPINHHVGSETFTECTADAALGALHVDEAMLAPLAVATGLEFQGITHGRFAAALTPVGCVELRLFTRHYVGL